MRKTPQPISVSLPPGTLYIEQIELLFELFREEGFMDPIIKLNDNQLSPQELLSYKEKHLNELCIQTQKPSCVSLDFRKTDIRLYTEKNGAKEIGMIEKIKLIVVDKKKSVLYFLTKRNTIISLACFCFLYVGIIFLEFFFFGYNPLDPKSYPSSIIIFGFPAFIIAMTIFEVIVPKMIKNSIRLVSKQDNPNFWQKNKDKIIVGLLVGILVAVANFILKYLFKPN